MLDERVVRNLILKRAMHSRDEYRDFRGSSDRNDAHENTLVPNVHSDARAVIMELEFYLNIYVKRCAVHHRIA